MAGSGIFKDVASVVGVAMLLHVVGVSPSLAQDATCSCVAPASNSVVGSIVSARGDVLVSQRGGYLPAVAGESLPIGSQVIVGDNSTADLKIGTGCRVSVPAASDVRLLPTLNGVCVRVAQAVDPLQTAAPRNTNVLLLGVGGALVIGGGIAIAIGSDGDGAISN